MSFFKGFGKASASAPAAAPVAASAVPSGMLDTTLRPICFDIPYQVTPTIAKAVGPEKFKKYEHILYLMAQLSRLVYCDTGIMWNVIEKSLGMSNDVVNKVISAYDAKFAGLKRTAITSQGGEGTGRPMESYSLAVSKGGPKYGTYVSTPEDMTCIFLNASKVRANSNSILLGSDVIVSFKGSSTMDNFKHDLMSQFTSADLAGLISSTGVKVGQSGHVTGSFVKPLVNGWGALVKGLTDHVTGDGVRLFLTGHSLGGAYASLFALILAEAKVTGSLPIMSKVKSIHLVSFGAPCILRDDARTAFNRHLDSGLMTLDRVVSQKVAARSAATQLLMGGVGGPNDVIPTIPAGFSHPGYRPLNNPLKNAWPETKGGRPYSIENVRKFYGAPGTTRYREPATWPFPESVGLGDRKEGAALKSIVTGLTAVTNVPDDVVGAAPTGKPFGANDPKALEQSGGGADKALYEKNTMLRVPNFVSVQGSVYAYAFAHAEYLGMFFFGGFRLPGMKNPASKNVAYFDLTSTGVKIQYTAVGVGAGRPANFSKNVEVPVNPGNNEDPGAPAPVGGRRRALTRRRRRGSRRTRRRRI